MFDLPLDIPPALHLLPSIKSMVNSKQLGYITRVIINNELILECGIVLMAIRIILYTVGNRKYIRCMQIFNLFISVTWKTGSAQREYQYCCYLLVLLIEKAVSHLDLDLRIK